MKRVQLLSLILFFSASSFATDDYIVDVAFGGSVKATYKNTYLTRLQNSDPYQYENCLAKGPTPENEAGALCAKATRKMVGCALKNNEDYIHCGLYAFQYTGKNCLEKKGFVDVLKAAGHIQKHDRAQLCSTPGTIMVFEGRCGSGPNRTPVSTEKCTEIMISKYGKTRQGLIDFGKRISKDMALPDSKYLEIAVSGEISGHLELVTLNGSSSKPGGSLPSFFSLFKGNGTSDKINYVSYAKRNIPASHNLDGSYSGARILKACYLPQRDVTQMFQDLGI